MVDLIFIRLNTIQIMQIYTCSFPNICPGNNSPFSKYIKGDLYFFFFLCGKYEDDYKFIIVIIKKAFIKLHKTKYMKKNIFNDGSSIFQSSQNILTGMSSVKDQPICNKNIRSYIVIYIDIFWHLKANNVIKYVLINL